MRSLHFFAVCMLLTLLSCVAAESVRVVPTTDDCDPSVMNASVSNADRTESSHSCLFDTCECESEEDSALAFSGLTIPIPAAHTLPPSIFSDLPSNLPDPIFHPPLFS
jgi:hypothetical protein